jgi:energy-coupling factor transport system ATP-binding protein
MAADSAVTVTGLRYQYPGAAGWVLDGIDLHVLAGSWLALMGANGSGKTTLCRALMALVPHATGGRFQGQVTIHGRDTRQHPPAALLGVVGLTFQDAESQLFSPTVTAEIVWGLEALGLPRPEMAERLAWAVHALRLDGLQGRFPGQLSGGQQRRLALAAVLAMQPAVLVLDSPLSGLDPQGRSEVLAALDDLRRSRQVTVIMAEADAEGVARFADEVAVLHGGRIVLGGAPAQVFTQETQLATWGVAVPPLAALANRVNARDGTALHFASVTAAEVLGQWTPVVRPVSPVPPPVTPDRAGPVPLAVDCIDLNFAYRPGEPVLAGIHWQVPAGQFVALVGANGSGKTTLAKHLVGLLRAQRGQLRVDGQDVARCSVGELARHVGFLFQNAERQIFSATVRDEVAFGPRNLGLPADETERRVTQALARFQLADLAERAPALLSFAERGRVTLAAVAALATPILVLDEPTVGLDPNAARLLLDWLVERHRQGTTIVLVTHDLGLVAAHAGRMVVLHNGQIVADGTPGELLSHDAHLAAAGLETPTLVRLAQQLGLPAMTADALAQALAGPVEAPHAV